MTKEAVSVTLTSDNLLWLRGQAHAGGGRSLSAVLDRLISAARVGGHVHEATIRSVVGTVRINDTDPQLLEADDAVRALFPAPLVAESEARYQASRRSSRGRPPRRRSR